MNIFSIHRIAASNLLKMKMKIYMNLKFVNIFVRYDYTSGSHLKLLTISKPEDDKTTDVVCARQSVWS